MAWEGVEGIGSPVQEEVQGLEEGVEGVDLSVGEGVGSWLSSSIFFFFLASSCMCHVIFCRTLVFKDLL